MPASVHTIALYVACLAKRLEYSTIKNYVVAIVSLHHENNVEAPNLGHFSIKEALAGVQRQRYELPHKRLPVTLETLLALKENLRAIPSPVRNTFWAACLTAFFTLLRSANLFATGCRSSNFCLRVKDVDLLPDRASFRVKVLKTNRFLDTRMKLIVPRLLEKPTLCAALALENMLCSVKPSPKDNLFSYIVDGKILSLSGRTFNSLLRSVLAAAGLETANFSAHSFRRGGATFYAFMGVDPSLIKAQGNWRGDCYLRYVDQTEALQEELGNCIHDFMKSLPEDR